MVVCFTSATCCETDSNSCVKQLLDTVIEAIAVPQSGIASKKLSVFTRVRDAAF